MSENWKEWLEKIPNSIYEVTLDQIFRVFELFMQSEGSNIDQINWTLVDRDVDNFLSTYKDDGINSLRERIHYLFLVLKEKTDAAIFIKAQILKSI